MERRRDRRAALQGFVVLDEVTPLRQSFNKESEEQGNSHGQSGNNIPGKGNCKCKDHEVEGPLVFSRTRYEFNE